MSTEVTHPWRARFLVTAIMLILGFIGLIVANVHHDGALLYWKIIAPVYGILAIALSWYLRHKKEEFRPTNLLKEVCLWAGAIGGVYLFNMFVAIGIMGRFEAALGVFVMLGLATYIGGLYIEPTLIVVGILLALFAGGVALADEYLYSIIIPVTLLFFIALYFIAKHKPNKE